jgi:hypothetical protein
MWLWESELHELGFRRKGERYWRCVRRFGLREDDHLSVFSWAEQALPAGGTRRPRYLVELTEFHVTFLIGHDNVHFYYHERLENDWVSAGHTSPGEIRRLGHDPPALRHRADRIAGAFVAALGGAFHPRQSAAP